MQVTVTVSPSSSEVATVYEYAASSFTLVTAVLVKEGASLVLTTVRTYWSDAVALLPSVHVTVIVCAPTLALTGVPEIVVPEIVIVLGAPLIE